MLRITADDDARVLTFRLEGRLEGPWVRELDRCWRGLMETASKPRITIDLTSLTYVDAAGMAHLAAMHAEGAEFIADDCMTKAVVEEIVNGNETHRAEGDATTRNDASSNVERRS